MKRDLYMKCVLTVIALALAVIALRPAKVIPEARAVDAVNCTGTLKGKGGGTVDANKMKDPHLNTEKDFDIYITCR